MKKFVKIAAIIVALNFLAGVRAYAEPEPYHGYNIDSSASLARFLYPEALKKYFDGKARGAMPETPTLARLEGGEASDAYGEAARGTSHGEMKAFIASLPTDFMRVLTLGEFPSLTASGVADAAFDLPMLVFSKPAVYDAGELKSLGRPIVYFQGQIHGDETSGGEALLAIASDLASDKGGVLGKICAIIIPRFNVDGAWKNQRGTDSAARAFPRLDLNRDAVSSLSPITLAVRNVLTTYRPDVFVDFHEMGYDFWGGEEYTSAGKATGGGKFHYDFDLATLVAHPANVPPGVTALARELERGVWSDLAAAGLGAWRYCDPADMIPGYDVGRLDGVRVMTRDGTLAQGYATYPKQLVEGAPDESMSDSAAGLAPSVALLFESRSPKVLTNFRTRVFAHYTAGMSVLSQAAAAPDFFLRTVASSGAEISSMAGNRAPSADIVLWSKQSEENSPDVTVLSLTDDKKSFTREALPIEKIHSNANLTPVKSVKRPYAYIISADRGEADSIAARIALTGVGMSRLVEAAEVEVEGYVIEGVSRADSASLGYSTRSADYFGRYSALTSGIDAVAATTLDAYFPAGTYLFYTSQPSANLAALAVEPMANRNLGNYWNMLTRLGRDAGGFIPAAVGGEYPVYRYMDPVPLASSVAATEAPMLTGAYVERVVPFDHEAVSRGSILGYDFVARYPTGGVPIFFDMLAPRERGGKKIENWYLYDWGKGGYKRVEIFSTGGVDMIRVRTEYISETGEVRAVARE